MERQQTAVIRADLEKKMVILVGPRQSGKTWLTRNIAATFENSVYLNYDNLNHRTIILSQSWLPNTELLVLDELHKMPDWKNYLKGLYDTRNQSMRLLVTGSARMDVFSKMGDSLAGRYFLHHLLPISPAELFHTDQPIDLERLLLRGGFPEPYLADNDIDAARWRAQYINSILSTDVFELEKIQNMHALRQVFAMLQRRVGSPISYQSIAEDVGVSANTVKKYIQVLEALYIIFRVTPYSTRIERSIKKEPKIYFFDLGLIEGNLDIQLENLTAICLYKHMLGVNDESGKNISIHYIRTKDNREIDFALAENNEVVQLIEVKTTDKKIHPALKKFQENLVVPSVQIVYALQQDQMVGSIKLQRLEHYLKSLYL